MADPHITHMSDHGRDWLASLEGGYRLTAYPDSKGIPTISAGLTFYPHSGRRVKLGDKIGLDWAKELFASAVQLFERVVDSHTTDDLLQHEFDALVSLAYNIGPQAYAGSTLARLVNEDAPFEALLPHFLEWHFSGGKPLPGLTTRRRLEAQVYQGGPYLDQSGLAFAPTFPLAPEAPQA